MLSKPNRAFFIVVPPNRISYESLSAYFLAACRPNRTIILILQPFKTKMVGNRADDGDDNDHAKNRRCIANVAAILQRLTEP